MASNGRGSPLSAQDLKKASESGSAHFCTCLNWLQNHMPASFFQEVTADDLVLIAHQLVLFEPSEHFTRIMLKDCAIFLCLDNPDADLMVLKEIKYHGIKNYQTFISNSAPPLTSKSEHLKIVIIHFALIEEEKPFEDALIAEKMAASLVTQFEKSGQPVEPSVILDLLYTLNSRFVRQLSEERLFLAVKLLLQAQLSDDCQLVVKRHEDWKKHQDMPSVQIILAWKNVPKYQFLYRLAKIVKRHHLFMQRVNACYVDPYGPNNRLVLSIALHGSSGKAAWDVAKIDDFIEELTTLKIFSDLPLIDQAYVDTGLVAGNLAPVLKLLIPLTHQVLLHADPHMYSLESIEEGFLRHSELGVKLCHLFRLRFDPQHRDINRFQEEKSTLLTLIDKIDTGQQVQDKRRKIILTQAVHLITSTLKTNFYTPQKSAVSLRLDPRFLDHLPFDRKEKFPELPFAIFFMKGPSFIGFHIRFEDLARGGLRTVIPAKLEQTLHERNNVFVECYNLSYTQHKKNKDIPEGGAKGIILVDYMESLDFAMRIYSNEMQHAKSSDSTIIKTLSEFKQAQRQVYLYQSQRAYISSLMTLINCNPKGELKASQVVDYYGQPEYIYLGPDENMHNQMIDWIAQYSVSENYALKSAFISSKPKAGINHKEFGVTSLGVNVYLHEVLKYLKIDPEKDPFTVKISGGPDGDVAGNQLLNLYRYYPKTAKVLAIVDVSGTIYDPEGLYLEELCQLFKEEKPIRFYPPERLHEGGFLLDLQTKKEDSRYSQLTLCWRRRGGQLIQDWVNGHEMNQLFRYTVHHTITDVFIPAGGRPRTLNQSNVTDFLDPQGHPTAKAIIEAANLYLTAEARTFLEQKGVIIIKDSSANKGGVICSSLEVQLGLVLGDEKFIKDKPLIMKDVLAFIREKALLEAQLLLKERDRTHESLIALSEKISAKINGYMYEILDYLKPLKLSDDPSDIYNRCLLGFVIPYLQHHHAHEVIARIPDLHKKAIIATFIASNLIYAKGLEWAPSIINILPVVIKELIDASDRSQ